MYEISFKLCSFECLNVESINNVFLKWHKRFSGLKEKGHGIGKNIEIQEVDLCKPCVNGKMTGFLFGTRTKSTRILEIIHSADCGPIFPATYNEEKLFCYFH